MPPTFIKSPAWLFASGQGPCEGFPRGLDRLNSSDRDACVDNGSKGQLLMHDPTIKIPGEQREAIGGHAWKYLHQVA